MAIVELGGPEPAHLPTDQVEGWPESVPRANPLLEFEFGLGASE